MIPIKDGAMEIHYRMRFWKNLVEILEAAKPLIIEAIRNGAKKNER